MKRAVWGLLVLILLGFSMFFGHLSYVEYEPVIESDAQKEAIKKVVIKKEEFGKPYDRVIDFEALKQINKDVAGWIYIPGTSVDYPILIGDTDTEYLHKDIEGHHSVLGCVFSYSSTSRELSDARTMLFGHNMRQYAMFGELRKYLEDEFRSEHTKIYVYTEKKTMELDVFAIFVCSETDTVFSDNPQLGSAEYQDLLRKLSVKNQYPDIQKDNITHFYNSQTFSLVTCRGNAGTSDRLVLNVISVREKYLLK